SEEVKEEPRTPSPTPETLQHKRSRSEMSPTAITSQPIRFQFNSTIQSQFTSPPAYRTRAKDGRAL
ncbi:MAG: hypothetical protein M1837_001579, partial [Sclerophora amabilis]